MEKKTQRDSRERPGLAAECDLLLERRPFLTVLLRRFVIIVVVVVVAIVFFIF